MKTVFVSSSEKEFLQEFLYSMVEDMTGLKWWSMHKAIRKERVYSLL